jgi:hypothetical protein
MMFSNFSKGSLYPSSRSRATMEVSPHPNDTWESNVSLFSEKKKCSTIFFSKKNELPPQKEKKIVFVNPDVILTSVVIRQIHLT